MNSVDKFILKRCGFREDYDPDNRFDLKTKVEYKGKVYEVSTIDLGLDHSFGMGEPLYYETMIFLIDNKKNIFEKANENEFGWFQKRYSTEKQARIGHKAVVRLLESGELK